MDSILLQLLFCTIRRFPTEKTHHILDNFLLLCNIKVLYRAYGEIREQNANCCKEEVE